MQVEEALTYVEWKERQDNKKTLEMLAEADRCSQLTITCQHQRANKYDGIWVKRDDKFIGYQVTCQDCHNSYIFNSDRPVPVTINLESAVRDYNKRLK